MNIHTIIRHIHKNLDTRAVKYAILYFIALRLGTILVMLGSEYLAPFPPNEYPRQFSSAERLQKPDYQGPLIERYLLPWYRYDTFHYLNVMEYGYLNQPLESVWPPLYPLLGKIANGVFRPPLLAALLISNLAALIFFYLFYVFVRTGWDTEVAQRSLLLLTISPVAFFLVAGYTESLFLLLSLGCVYASQRRHWCWAGVCGSLATLTRLQGIFLVIPMLVVCVQDLQNKSHTSFKLWLKPALALVLPPLAFLGFAAYIHFGLKFPWPWETLTAQWDQRSGWPWEGFLGNIAFMIGIIDSPFAYPAIVAVDLILGLLAVLLLLTGFKVLPLPVWIYGMIILWISITKISTDSLLVSTSRYLLVDFPVFILLAYHFKHKVTLFTFAGLSMACQALLLFSFYRWIFVA